MRNNFIQELDVVNKSECLSVISEKSFDEHASKKLQLPPDHAEDLDDLIYNNYIHAESTTDTNTGKISSESTGTHVSDKPRDRFASKLDNSHTHRLIYQFEKLNTSDDTTKIGFPYGGKLFYRNNTNKCVDQNKKDANKSVYEPRYRIQQSILMT
jgi:hypothetical protein